MVSHLVMSSCTIPVWPPSSPQDAGVLDGGVLPPDQLLRGPAGPPNLLRHRRDLPQGRSRGSARFDRHTRADIRTSKTMISWGEKETSRESRKAALRISHLLSRCQVVFTKRCHYNYYCHYCHYYYYHNLSFWVMSQFVLSFVTIWVFKFCHNFFFR